MTMKRQPYAEFYKSEMIDTPLRGMAVAGVEMITGQSLSPLLRISAYAEHVRLVQSMFLQ